VPQLAHRLKGSSAAMGARRLADLCRRLEGNDAGSPELDGALRALLAETRLVGAAVATMLGSAP
jgi:HPt (histidine-containing phosphotransfer) domain-containing protein